LISGSGKPKTGKETLNERGWEMGGKGEEWGRKLSGGSTFFYEI